jgi:uncharacterized membrane protein YedE/YeeE
MNLFIGAFVSGLIFAIGLGLSGMTQPAKVIAFLDLAGDWDPSLAFVMMGAILVHSTLYRLIRRRPAPLFAPVFTIPTRTDNDLRLLGGAALFGVGWGLGGFCPGPVVTSLVSGHRAVLLFVVSMLIGMYLYKIIDQLKTRQTSASRSVPATMA